jgi:hypothetical protein
MQQQVESNHSLYHIEAEWSASKEAVTMAKACDAQRKAFA